MAFAIVTHFELSGSVGGNGIQLMGETVIAGADVSQGQYRVELTFVVMPGDTIAEARANFAAAVRAFAAESVPNTSNGVGVTIAANAVIQPTYSNS